jgi:hypothetical protein
VAEHELENLLGGFSAGTLTAEERRQLYAAALQDQQLFTALADEQALKELLADPAVRRKLLQALAQPHEARGWRSWLDRFMTPPGLAWVGGVAVGVVAVILGLNVYQESLRQTSETAAVEEGRPPTAPQATPPIQASPEDTEAKRSKAAPPADSATKDALTKPLNTREQAAASRPPEKSRSVAEHADTREPPRQKESQKLDAPIAALGKSREEPASTSDHPPAPSAPVSGVDVQILAQHGEGAATGPSARALFYGQIPAPEVGLRTQEMEAESAQKTDRFALARKAPERPSVVKPLALRFSFVIRESDGQEREVDVGTAATAAGTVTLKLESNQEAYVQIWRRAGDSLPELLLPAKETGRISLKTVAGQRQQMTVPAESDRLIVRLSRVPFGPITRQEAVMAGRGPTGQVAELSSITAEQATYVANPDPSATELALEVPLKPRATR